MWGPGCVCSRTQWREAAGLRVWLRTMPPQGLWREWMDTAPLFPRSGTSQTVSGLRAARAVLPLAASSDHNTLGGHTGRQDPRKHSSL